MKVALSAAPAIIANPTNYCKYNVVPDQILESRPTKTSLRRRSHWNKYPLPYEKKSMENHEYAHHGTWCSGFLWFRSTPCRLLFML